MLEQTLYEDFGSVIEHRREDEDVDVPHRGLSVARVLREAGDSVAVVETRTIGVGDDGPRRVHVRWDRDLDEDG